MKNYYLWFKDKYVSSDYRATNEIRSKGLMLEQAQVDVVKEVNAQLGREFAYINIKSKARFAGHEASPFYDKENKNGWIKPISIFKGALDKLDKINPWSDDIEVVRPPRPGRSYCLLDLFFLFWEADF